MEPLEILLEFARSEATGDPHSFRFGPQAYIVRTPRGGFGRSELPWDTALLGKLAAVREPGHRPELLVEIGEVLRGFLAPTGWELLEQQISTAVQQRRGVMVTIRSAAAELFALPWELLTLRATGQSLGGLPGVLVRYEWPETATAARVETERPGHLLVAWSAAGGAVPAGEHIAAARAAGDAVPFDPARDVIGDVSPSRLAAELTRREQEGRPVAVLHLLCHGGAQGAVFGLVLDGETDMDPHTLLDPGRLQQLLAPYAGTLRVVVLAACDSGNQGDFGGRIGSTAQMLHRAGLAAVVASRYPLSVAGSVRLTRGLYAGLGQGAPLEQAFLRARTDLVGDTTSLDWASVQLYARAADGAAMSPFTSPVRPTLALPVLPPVEAPRRRWPLLAAGAAVLGAALAVWKFAGSTPTSDAVPVAVASTSTRVEASETPAKVEPPVETKTETKVETKAETKIEPPVEPKVTPTDRKKGAGTTKPVEKEEGECSPAAASFLRNQLPDRGGAAKLLLRADIHGKLSARGKDSAAVAAANQELADVDRARVKARLGDELPCRCDHEW